MHHFATEMCTCVTKWCIVGYLSKAFWDFYDWSVDCPSPSSAHNALLKVLLIAKMLLKLLTKMLGSCFFLRTCIWRCTSFAKYPDFFQFINHSSSDSRYILMFFRIVLSFWIGTCKNTLISNIHRMQYRLKLCFMMAQSWPLLHPGISLINRFIEPILNLGLA